jgi:methylmalonyl-CoA mutase N-terminal domain/subunit
VVGVNRFADERAATPPPFIHDPGVEAARAEFLRDWRASRAAAPHAAALAAVGAAARGSDNLLPPILAALTAQATLGEVCDALRAVFGVHRPGEKP